MRFVIDQQRCEGHGLCSAAAPDDIALDEDDRPYLLRPEVPAGAEEAAVAAARVCPVSAITVAE